MLYRPVRRVWSQVAMRGGGLSSICTLCVCVCCRQRRETPNSYSRQSTITLPLLHAPISVSLQSPHTETLTHRHPGNHNQPTPVPVQQHQNKTPVCQSVYPTLHPSSLDPHPTPLHYNQQRYTKQKRNVRQAQENIRQKSHCARLGMVREGSVERCCSCCFCFCCLYNYYCWCKEW